MSRLQQKAVPHLRRFHAPPLPRSSACAIQLYDGDGNVTGGRIYAAMNQVMR